ncbi:MAG: hypothetical protein HUJ61_08590, partial [Bacilli bacterium]|nr:hypothetical protein [Bacilli bacterium]
LPGELHVDVYYHIFKKEDAFEIEFKAISSEDTYCNLTNHVYWNLEGDNTRDILEEKLIINADKYVDIDQELIINDIIPVNEIFDFRQGMKFKEHMKDAAAMYPCASGYDHDYILNDTSLACILFSSDENIVLKVYTDNPVCHLFTQNPIPENERYHAVALEMQKEVFFLDKILLKKNELYHQTTKYVFES